MTSRVFLETIWKNEFFWNRKTEYDFGEFYDVDTFEGSSWDNYQHCRKQFTYGLIDAIQAKNLSLAEAILAINEEKQFLMLNCRGPHNFTLLMYASRVGYTNIVRKLLDLGADPDLQNKSGCTALMICCSLFWDSEFDPKNVIPILLEKGANVNLQDKSGETVLMKISGFGNCSELVEMLINHGADLNIENKNKNNALGLACYWGRENNLEAMLRSKKKIKKKYLKRAFLEASYGGYESMFDSIVEYDFDALDISTYNEAMEGACSNNHRAIAEKLLNFGADVNFINDGGYSLLWFATVRNRESIVELLLSRGADPSISLRNARSALEIAQSHNYINIVRMMEEAISPSTS